MQMLNKLQGSQCQHARRGSMKTAAARVPTAFRLTQSARKNTSNVVVRAGGKLDDVSLFGDSGATSGLSGPEVRDGPKAKANLDDIPLNSTVGIDYTALCDFLKEGDFRKADDETRALLIRLAGEEAEKRNWVYWTEVKTISVDDFQTMDKLWKAASNNKFGFSVQKEIWRQSQKRWPKFFKNLDWIQVSGLLSVDNDYQMIVK
eukprot:gene15821-21941_t